MIILPTLAQHWSSIGPVDLNYIIRNHVVHGGTVDKIILAQSYLPKLT